jgi:hypothetical protein
MLRVVPTKISLSLQKTTIIRQKSYFQICKDKSTQLKNSSINGLNGVKDKTYDSSKITDELKKKSINNFKITKNKINNSVKNNIGVTKELITNTLDSYSKNFINYPRKFIMKVLIFIFLLLVIKPFIKGYYYKYEKIIHKQLE